MRLGHERGADSSMQLPYDARYRCDAGSRLFLVQLRFMLNSLRTRECRSRVSGLCRMLPLWAAGFIAGLSSCSRDEREIEIRFALEAVPQVEVRELSFYVHDVQLLRTDGEPLRVTLASESPWQSHDVALLDLVGTDASRRDIVRGRVSRGEASYAGLRFVLGVPVELNHANPLQAAAPLDRADLFWAWQTGHKFLRVDLADAGREWAFHLGSTGCSSPSAVRPPPQPCSQPNRLVVEVTGFDPTRVPVRVALHQLAAAMRAANYAACTGAYAHDAACGPPYATTGLQRESGKCPAAGCAQTLFVAGRPAS